MKKKWCIRFDLKNLGKAIVIIAFCAILAPALLGGCKININLPDPNEAGGAADERVPEADKPADKPDTEADEPADKPDKKPAAPIGTLPDDPYSFAFMLDGDLYSLPAPFSALASNGWVIVDSTAGSFFSDYNPQDRNKYYTATIQNGGHETTVELIDTGNDTKKPADCDVCGIGIDYFAAEKYGMELVFPGNLKIGDPAARVKQLYGEPSEFDGDDTSASYIYYGDDGYSFIWVNTMNGGVCFLNMRNIY